MSSSPRTHLLLHQVLQVGDPLRVLGVTADVVLVEEGLRQRRGGKRREGDAADSRKEIEKQL